MRPANFLGWWEYFTKERLQRKFNGGSVPFAMMEAGEERTTLNVAR
jgi:hypothetical protein